ncbi:hypothetical protein QBC44DRAFT_370701 [Cladorrhinum sp. PSN332]|nr:hypothetical protein QBC44DRAFT_370701 [Cladorrhinum sp. PSN332]
MGTSTTIPQAFNWEKIRGSLLSDNDQIASMNNFTVVTAKSIYEGARIGLGLDQMVKEAREKLKQARALLLEDLQLTLKHGYDDKRRAAATTRHAFFIHAVEMSTEWLNDEKNGELVRKLGYVIIEPAKVDEALAALNIGTDWYVVHAAPETTFDNVEKEWVHVDDVSIIDKRMAASEAALNGIKTTAINTKNLSSGRSSFLGNAFGRITGKK